MTTLLQQQVYIRSGSGLRIFNNKLTFGLLLQQYKVEIWSALKTCKIFGMSCTFAGYGNPESVRTLRD
jgi:thiosulfate reductase cytochrome b subunit